LGFFYFLFESQSGKMQQTSQNGENTNNNNSWQPSTGLLSPNFDPDRQENTDTSPSDVIVASIQLTALVIRCEI